MRIVTGAVFMLNLLAWIAFDVVCWFLTGVSLGVVVLFGIVAFLIAWGISGEAVVTPLDYFAYPEWDVFVKKIKWANNVCLISMTIFAFLCIVMNWLGIREFLDLKV